MSTILQALEKSKLTQAGGPPPITQPEKKTNLWKIALSVALFVIITLLSTLIYILLNPNNEPQILVATPTERAPINNNATKIIFETQPLPVLAPIPKKKKVKAVVETISTEHEESAIKPMQVTSNQEETYIEPIEDQQTIDYDAIPNDLKERFKLAVLMTDIDEHDNSLNDIDPTEEEVSDGSDIREMSSDFQNKVSPIRYDSHMYSSAIEERWIRINGEILREGDVDSTGQLELLEIQPQRSIFRLGRQSFSIESLEDWLGY